MQGRGAADERPWSGVGCGKSGAIVHGPTTVAMAAALPDGLRHGALYPVRCRFDRPAAPLYLSPLRLFPVPRTTTAEIHAGSATVEKSQFQAVDLGDLLLLTGKEHR